LGTPAPASLIPGRGTPLHPRMKKSGPFLGAAPGVSLVGLQVYSLYPAYSPALTWNGSGMTTQILIQPVEHSGRHDGANI